MGRGSSFTRGVGGWIDGTVGRVCGGDGDGDGIPYSSRRRGSLNKIEDRSILYIRRMDKKERNGMGGTRREGSRPRVEEQSRYAAVQMVVREVLEIP